MAVMETKQFAPPAISPARNTTRETPAILDIEKDGSAELKESTEHTAVHINPEIEKRVVRKLDLHVTPLVTFLCRCCLLPEPQCEQSCLL